MVALAVPSRCSPTATTCFPVQVPGPPGAPCTPCQNGVDGINAFTLTTASFVMPGVGSSAIVEVLNTSWMVPTTNFGMVGQVNGTVLVVQFAGLMLVEQVIDDTHVLLVNVGDAFNAPAGVIIPAGSKVGIGALSGSSTPSTSGIIITDGPPPVGIHAADIWVDQQTSSVWYWSPALVDWVQLIG